MECSWRGSDGDRVRLHTQQLLAEFLPQRDTRIRKTVASNSINND